MKNKKGFTLSELLVVIAILGLLAAIPFMFMPKLRGEETKAYSQETAGQITANQASQEQAVSESGEGKVNPAPAEEPEKIEDAPQPEMQEEITEEDSKEASQINMAIVIAERCMRDAEKYEYPAVGEERIEDRADKITPAIYYALKALYYQNIALAGQNRAIANLLKEKVGK